MKDNGELKFTMDTQVIFGNSCVAQVSDKLKNEGYQRAIIVSDSGVDAAGILTKVDRALSDGGVATAKFTEISPNPTVEEVEKAYRVAEEFKPDVIIGIGGGSPIDAAKVLAVMMTNDKNIADLEGVDKFEECPMPLLAIPTTAGTGSEVTVFSVITDSEREYKLTIGGRSMAPKWAFVDPGLTVSLPRSITASTGLDALVHAIESYTSTISTPLSELFSKKAIEIISRNLRQAVYNGENINARGSMIYASLLAGIAFSNTRLGNVHAMSHPLSAIYHVPHGVANSILLPVVMRFNLPACPEKYEKIAELMGEPLDNSLSIYENALKSLYAVERLSSDIGIPPNFSAYNVDKKTISTMADDAMKSGNIQVNPRATSLSDIVELYKKVIK